MDTVLGLLELVVYVLAVLALSMALTWLVIKISPSQSAKEQQANADAKT
jgi:predicted acyltransferase